MQVALEFATHSGKPPHVVDVPDETPEIERYRVALEIAVKAKIDLSWLFAPFGASLDGARLVGARLDRASLVGASLDGASLDGASLDGASLDRASLDRASLDRASLDRASLVGARLDRASLVGASLDGASLDGARLDGASLVGARLDRASLVGASLVGASLDRASLDRASLDRASLRSIKADLFLILTGARMETPGLLAALRAGKVDGSTYQGGCACLIGTIANIRHVPVASLERDASRPAERWFLAIRKGDTPATNPIAKITEGWIVEFLAANGLPQEVAP